MNQTEFSYVTPCGGCCDDCGHKKNNKCAGCIDSGGKCIHMWSESGGVCRTYKCCSEHNVSFCSLCSDFPCKWLVKWFDDWNKDGIENLKRWRDKWQH